MATQTQMVVTIAFGVFICFGFLVRTNQLQRDLFKDITSQSEDKNQRYNLQDTPTGWMERSSTSSVTYKLPEPKFFPCRHGDWFAVYTRRSVTPILVLYNTGFPTKPCGMLKLSCRIHADIEEVWLHDAGSGKRRWPAGDNAIGEIVAHNIQMLSPSAAQVAIAGGSVVIQNASDVMHADELAKVPLSCFQERDTLVGYVMEYANVTINGLPTPKTLSPNDSRSILAIASMWLLDSASLNRDRSGSNVLKNDKGEIVPMDLEKLLPTRLWDCSSDGKFEDSVKKYSIKPPLLKHIPSCSPLCHALLNKAITILNEFYNNQDLSTKLNRSLNMEPVVKLLLNEGGVSVRPTLCCEKMKLCRRCYPCRRNSAFSEVFQTRLEESCKSKYQNVEPLDMLTEEIAIRFNFVKSALQSLREECKAFV